MAISTSTSDDKLKIQNFFVLLFFCAIFYGDIYLIRFVIPFSMLLVPALFFLGLWRRGWRAPRPLLPAVGLLAALATIPVIQYAQGSGPNRADLALYLPIIYALATHAALSTWGPASPTMIWRGICAGAALTGAVMLVMMFVAPPNFFLIPGQLPVAWTEAPITQTEAPTTQTDAGTPLDAGLPTVEVSASETAFYEIKNLARNALGRSNYLSAFFVFAFTVAMFASRYAAAVALAALAAITMSRFGFLAIGMASLFWLLSRRRVGGIAIAVATGTLTSMVTLTLLFWGGKTGLPGGTSITARAEMLQTSWGPIAANWPVGLPRSELMSRFGLLIEWSPHNSIATILAYFGVFGLVLYALYLFTGLRQMYIAGGSSPVLYGCYFGFLVLLAWSTLEIITLTPAFEILFACLTALSWSSNTSKKDATAHAALCDRGDSVDATL